MLEFIRATTNDLEDYMKKMWYRKIGETEPKEDKNVFFLFEYEKII